MTTIVVLGGADGSLGTLRTARELGLHTICVDMRTDAPGALAADELLNISTLHADELAGVLGPRRDVAAVISPASDVNLPTQFALANALGLPCGLSDAAVRASVDKGYFRQVCDDLGLPGPRFVQGTPAEVARTAPAVAPRLMVKPTDSSGSRGVACVSDLALLPDAIATANAFSGSGVVIVEEFLTGIDFTAEAIVVDGRVELLGISARRLTPPPYFVTVEHQMPAEEIPADAVRATLDALCAALDYRWGRVERRSDADRGRPADRRRMGCPPRWQRSGGVAAVGLRRGRDRCVYPDGPRRAGRPDARGCPAAPACACSAPRNPAN